MSWVRISTSTDPGVTITVGKKIVALTLLSSALTALGWGPTDRVALELGDGEHAGWVRLALDADGTEGEASSGRLVLSVPRSTLPDLAEARAAPLVWRASEGAIEVRLPTVAVASRVKPRLVAALADAPRPIAVPLEHAEFHADAWVNGVELVFLSDGTCLVNDRIVPVADVRVEVKRQLEAA